MTSRIHTLILSIAAHGVRLGNVLGALGLLALAAALAVLVSSCSSGPQTAGTGAATSPSCAWTFTAGGESPPTGATLQLCHDCTIERVEMSCLFDRTTSSPATNQRGVEVDDVRVDPRTSVSATGPQ